MCSALSPADEQDEPVRRLTSSCQLALASLVADFTDKSWAMASDQVAKSAGKFAEAASGGAAAEAAKDAVAKASSRALNYWTAAADLKLYAADDLALGIAAFPQHPAQASWNHELAQRAGECSLALLPGVLMRASATLSASVSGGASGRMNELESLQLMVKAAEAALLRRLAGPGHSDGDRGHAELGLLPAAPAVAALRAISQLSSCSEGRPGASAEVRPALIVLLQRLGELAEREELPAKAAVRAVQSLQALRLQPPPALVASLAETATGLAPEELLVALRPLSAQSVKASGSGHLFAALATRAMGQLKSSRQAWELEGICRNLRIEIGEVRPDEDIAKEEYDERPGKDA
eukprot:TRINITY_DN42529_c0_g1_i1.p1 TRINITY_DN42529_c0_g1~~TRINITY_DN42529_c0_g1_i1.p1  ORF type:complete len:351 (+),score=83.40 TRINITY_DN42529_c0_g1_i1:242-1294(+)